MIYVLLLLRDFLTFLGSLFLGSCSVPEGGPSGFLKRQVLVSFHHGEEIDVGVVGKLTFPFLSILIGLCEEVRTVRCLSDG